MTNQTRSSKPEIRARIADVVVAFAIFVSSCLIVIAGGHGVAFMGMFVLDGFVNFLFSFWSAFTWAALATGIAGLLPALPRIIIRWMALATAVGFWIWLLIFTEWLLATALTSLPLIGVLVWQICRTLRTSDFA
ncbi:MAG: hypothetical protein U1F71_07340 [Verrucomicrobiaceae bacterium]